MREFRCHICDGIASDYCIACNRPVCSLCSNDDGLCRRCRFVSTSGIGHTQLRDILNIPLMLIGIAMIVTGMIIVSYASIINSNVIQDSNNNGSGIIVVLPFPFIVYTSDPTITILMLIAVLLIPLLLFLWFMKKTSIL